MDNLDSQVSDMAYCSAEEKHCIPEDAIMHL